jgi:hypothetical protein
MRSKERIIVVSVRFPTIVDAQQMVQGISQMVLQTKPN